MQTEPRVHAVQTLPRTGFQIHHRALALWVAKGDPSIRIIGGARALPGDPVSLIKSYV